MKRQLMIDTERSLAFLVLGRHSVSNIHLGALQNFSRAVAYASCSPPAAHHTLRHRLAGQWYERTRISLMTCYGHHNITSMARHGSATAGSVTGQVLSLVTDEERGGAVLQELQASWQPIPEPPFPDFLRWPRCWDVTAGKDHGCITVWTRTIGPLYQITASIGSPY